jgi:ATP-dependent exoDNAse (exonuclease V) alpha subunit
MQKFGIQTVELKQTQRQKTDITKSVVAAYNNRDTDLALKILDDKALFTEKDSYEQRVDFAVDKYVKNEDTLIITSKNAERKEINERVRSKILLDAEDHSFLIKEAKQIFPIDVYFAENYNVNDIVIMNGKVPNFKTGQEGKIISIDKNNNSIDIEFQTKKETKIKTINLKDFGNKINVYNEVSKPFKEGEKIIFTKNIRNSPIKNGVVGNIIKIDSDMVRAKLSNGKEYQFNIKDYNYIDHGYAITDYKAQGVTANDVLVVADSRMANQNSFYVQVTRAKNNIEVVTDNKDMLKQNIKIKDEKLSTLDYTGDRHGTNHKRDYGTIRRDAPGRDAKTGRDRHNTPKNDKSSNRSGKRDNSYLGNLKRIFQSIRRRLGSTRFTEIGKHTNMPELQRNQRRRREVLTQLSKAADKTKSQGKER